MRRQTIIHRERLEQIRERTSFSFTKSRVGGRWYWIRVALLLIAVSALTWYARQGENNPFADKRTVTVSGSAGGYAVTCRTGRGGMRTVGELRVRANGGVERVGAPGGRVSVSDAYPFGGNVRAALLTYAGMDILVCDSAVFAPRADGTRSRFWERLELLIVPPADEADILRVRDCFRPRHMIVTPPCAMTPLPNVLCGGGETFRYGFEIKNGKLQFVD